MNFQEITDQMSETYKRKNADYGNSFDQTLDEFGLIASVIRLHDKVNRIKQLAKNKNQVKDESIKDTLLDLANYAVMTICWIDNHEN